MKHVFDFNIKFIFINTRTTRNMYQEDFHFKILSQELKKYYLFLL